MMKQNQMTDIELLTNVLTAGMYVSYIEIACGFETSKGVISTLAKLALITQRDVVSELAARIGIDSDELVLRSEDIHNMLMRRIDEAKE